MREKQSHTALHSIPELIKMKNIWGTLGPRPCVRTVYRWALKGRAGVQLRAVRISHELFATIAWVRRFVILSMGQIPDQKTESAAKR
jgi:hypothetical protein